MEIKKGKYYLCTHNCALFTVGRIYKSEEDLWLRNDVGKPSAFTTLSGELDSMPEHRFTDKIAVHTPTQEDWDYVVKTLDMNIKFTTTGIWNKFEKNSCIELNREDYNYKSRLLEHNFNIITMQQFKELFEPQEQGKKESYGKLPYELDWSFVEQMAERMQANKGDKYPMYNWQKPIDINELKKGLSRHFIAVQKGVYEDDGREFGHLEAIACNIMMLNYQLKYNNK